MINTNVLADRFSNLNLRSRLARNILRHRRRTKSATTFTAEVALLEERQLMSTTRHHRLPGRLTATTQYEMPLAPAGSINKYDTVAKLSDVLFTGAPDVGNTPIKQLTLYNNTTETIYPFLYDSNTGQSDAGGYYDPRDKHNQQYRGYIGYRVGQTDYLGLEPGHSITINVPFVFWDSGRAGIATDGADLLPKDPNTSKASPTTNPFFFFYKNIGTDGGDGSNTARYVVDAAASSGGNGIVMYYHCSDPSVGPGSDTPNQLIEFSIRDKPFLSKFNTPDNPIDSKALVTLINYDVSYVDHLILPVAMEAQGVPIPNTNTSKDFGWIGAKDAFLGSNSIQAALKRFTSNGPGNGLGTYFQVGNKDLGWPTFFNPNYATDPTAGLRIPSGANILLDSPLAAKKSNYDRPFGATNHWMLSSGGNKPVKASANATFYLPNKVVLTPTKDLPAILKQLHKGMTAVVNSKPVGTIKSIDAPTHTVYLDGAPSIPDKTNASFDFFSPVSDPYATKITNLWYSWTSYYQNLDVFKKFKPETLTANVSSDSDNGNNDYRILTFSAPHPELAVGMQVTGGGISFLTTILKIVTVNGVQQYFLSRPVPGVTSPTAISFTFKPPQGIAFTSETTNIPLEFKTTDAQAYAKDFAATVYEAMSVFSTADTRDAHLPSSMAIVENVIGGNVGFLPTADAKPVYVNISADARDLVKSALRGVPDFNTSPESKWYPPPSFGTGGHTYNVFNLDPYVWFVHRELHLSGYGFSFDDDTADVEGGGSASLAVAVGGLNHLNNPAQWQASTPWGPVQSMATISQARINNQDVTVISLADKTAYNQVKADDFKNGLTGAYVTGGPILAGTRLAATADISKNQFVLSQRAPSTSNPVSLTFYGKPPA